MPVVGVAGATPGVTVCVTLVVVAGEVEIGVVTVWLLADAGPVPFTVVLIAGLFAPLAPAVFDGPVIVLGPAIFVRPGISLMLAPPPLIFPPRATFLIPLMFWLPETPRGPTPLIPAMFGLIRAVVLGARVGRRDPMLRLGERMMLCAFAAEMPRAQIENVTAIREWAEASLKTRLIIWRYPNMCLLAHFKAVSQVGQAILT
jgi:hypothetical protein